MIFLKNIWRIFLQTGITILLEILPVILITIIEQMTGKTVEVQLILADQHANAALSTISVDDALTQAIHGIPVEEDDESDFDDGEE